MYLGMSLIDADKAGSNRGTDEGGKLKETGTIYWYSPNTGATNVSGFSALPGGFRNDDGYYIDVGGYANFWSSTESVLGTPLCRKLHYLISNVYRYFGNKDYGLSVRCVQD